MSVKSFNFYKQIKDGTLKTFSFLNVLESFKNLAPNEKV